VVLASLSGLAAGYAGGLREAAGPVAVVAETGVERVYAAVSGSVVTVILGKAAGSGFFFDRGLVATNAHVVTGALGSGEEPVGARVTVRLGDGRERQGSVTAVDTRMDVAIVAVDDAEEVAVLPFAADGVRAGQQVLAVGAPLELSGSVSVGVVSHPARSTTYRQDPVQAVLIQSDVAINPGNSGGPLLDAAGRVVGMVTLRPDESAGRPVVGVSFAVPARFVQASLAKLRRSGVAQYVTLGVSGRASNPDDAVDGFVVQSVTRQGPAAVAGVQTGDVITRVAGSPVSGYGDLTAAVAEQEPGDAVEVVVDRGEIPRRMTVELTLRS
jgi:S1-C subfamily serine protease